MSQREILIEHNQVDSDSPSVDYIEDYYFHHANRRGKVREIASLSERQQDHILRHIAFRLRQKRRVVSGRFLFAEFISNPNVKQAQNKKTRYFRDKRGHPHKQDKKTGMFVAYSKAERRLVDKQRQHSRQSQSKTTQGGP